MQKKLYVFIYLFKKYIKERKSCFSYLCTTPRRVEGLEVKLHSLLTLALDVSEW
jgi:hypothetical protein